MFPRQSKSSSQVRLKTFYSMKWWSLKLLLLWLWPGSISSVYITAEGYDFQPIEAFNDVSADTELIRRAVETLPRHQIETYPKVLRLNGNYSLARNSAFTNEYGPKEDLWNDGYTQKNSSRDVVVISPASQGKGGRKYLVLVRNRWFRNVFHALYAYLSEISEMASWSSSTRASKIEVVMQIEWDKWEPRAKLRNMASRFGLTSCSGTLFFSCKLGQKSFDLSRTLARAKIIDIVVEAFQVEETKEFNWAYDRESGTNFYTDIDDLPHEAGIVAGIIESVSLTHKFVAEKTTASTSSLKPSHMSFREFKKVLMNELKTVGGLLATNYGLPVKAWIEEGYRAVAEVLKDAFFHDFPLHVLGHEVFVRSEKKKNTSMESKLKNNLGLLSLAAFARGLGQIASSSEVENSLDSSGSRVQQARGMKLLSFKTNNFSVDGDFDRDTREKYVGIDVKPKRPKRSPNYRNPFGTAVGVSPSTSNKHRVNNRFPGYGQPSLQSIPGIGSVPDQVYPQPPPRYSGAEHMYPSGVVAPSPMIPGTVGGKIKGVDWRIFCAKPNLSPGEKGWCGCHKGKDIPFGLSQNLGDAVGNVFNGRPINDRQNVFDEAINTGLGVVYCGTSAAIIDTAGELLKVVGLSELKGVLGQAAEVVGVAAGAAGSIAHGLPLAHLANQGMKVVADMLGLQGLLGMGRAATAEDDTKISRIYTKSSQDLLRDSEEMARPAITTDVDLFGQVGWELHNVNPVSPKLETVFATFRRKRFVAFGNCPYRRVTKSDFQKVNTISDVGELIYTVMRTHCTSQISAFVELVNEQAVVLNDDKTISLNQTFYLLSQKLLSEDELDRITTALTVSVFSQLLFSPGLKLRTKMPPESDVFYPISKPVHFLYVYATEFLKQAKRYVPAHLVKLGRHLGFTLKSAFVKRLQDYHCLVHMPSDQITESLRLSAKKDLCLMLQLVEYIAHGQSSGISADLIEERVRNFGEDNMIMIEQKLTQYMSIPQKN